MKPDLIQLRRDLHRLAELSFVEYKTHDYLMKHLKALGLNPKTCAGTGVVVTLGTHLPAKAVMLRADIDALPIHEATGLPFASETPGVMHACGHDGHTAMVMGALHFCLQEQQQLQRPVKFVFQPAEEQGGGARVMVEQGVLQDPEVGEAYGLHLCNRLPSNSLGLASGIFSAYIDEFHVTIRGRGGHAARPYLCIEPIPIAARLIMEMQMVVARELNAMHANVFTFAAISSGSRFNVIADTCELKGTLRSLSEADREHMLKRFRQKLECLQIEYGCSFDLELLTGYPAIYNDSHCTKVVEEAANKVLGCGHIYPEIMGMGGEDMSYFLQKVPGCYFLLGSGGRHLQYAAHHNPAFNFDESVLATGSSIFSEIIRLRAFQPQECK